MVFEDYNNIIKERRALEDPYNKVTITKEKYKQLLEASEKCEAIVKEYRDIVAKKTELEKQIELLKQDGRKLKELEEKTEKYSNSLLRVQAEYENYRKMNQRENERYELKYKEKLLTKFVKLYEDLTRALKVLNELDLNDSIKKGFEMIITNFQKILEEEGVKPMLSEGEKFDPCKHEALMVEVNEELPENTIIEELNKGYYLNNKVLRPAGVKISKTKSKL
ncbi:MAG TPA: nucleotide exchange factor GrpE [Candidatus Nanopelagicaceae bacterium]|nr:nucleotide exchange factor GrpE [Candidatus Nanopelagicaceae bacterium]